MRIRVKVNVRETCAASPSPIYNDLIQVQNQIES